MKLYLISALSAAALALTATPGLANDFQENSSADLSAVFGLNYSGTTVNGPLFNRPNANGNSAPTSLSTFATAVPYDALQFSIAATGAYNFLSVTNPTYDNYLVLYSGSFNPASPLTNAVIANDDFPTIGRSGFTANLQTGTSYFLVTTGFSNTSAGSFTNTVTAVPEPSTWVMILGASLTGLMVWGKRRPGFAVGRA